MKRELVFRVTQAVKWLGPLSWTEVVRHLERDEGFFGRLFLTERVYWALRWLVGAGVLETRTARSADRRRDAVRGGRPVTLYRLVEADPIPWPEALSA